MRKGISIGVLTVLFLSALVMVAPRSASAEIEWTLKKKMNLEVTPLDIASSADGKWIYLLTPGEIVVYSEADGKVVKRVPVDKAFDRLTYSAADNTLIVTSTSGKTMDIIQLELVYHFSLEGLPFEGGKNAPVTIAVFSDYQ